MRKKPGIGFDKIFRYLLLVILIGVTVGWRLISFYFLLIISSLLFFILEIIFSGSPPLKPRQATAAGQED